MSNWDSEILIVKLIFDTELVTSATTWLSCEFAADVLVSANELWKALHAS